MWKRLGALLFIFILGGQVWAGVCGCFDNGAPRMKCCQKKNAAKGDAMSRTTCCDAVCGLPVGERPNRIQNDASFKMPAMTEAIAHRFEFLPRIVRRGVAHRSPAALEFPSLYSRPPNLYLFNHSFLI